MLYIPYKEFEYTLKKANETWIETYLSHKHIIDAIEKYFFLSIKKWDDIDLSSTTIASTIEEMFVLNFS